MNAANDSLPGLSLNCSSGRWTDDDRRCVAALAALPNMTTARLVALQSGRSPRQAVAMALGEIAPSKAIAATFGRSGDLAGQWAEAGRTMTPERMGEWCAELSVQILLPLDDLYPPLLIDDPKRPAVLFAHGDMAALDRRRVGIVGTRNPTRRGGQTAARFGRELADAGVAVVSGLALGIDGAAHRGVLSSDGPGPVAIVANGHDLPYPRRHHSLWREVAERGVVLSEWPPGTKPDAFRFPQRNRILAALSEVVVVIESRERGGSLITAREAAERGVDVFAVPGPIDERACAGTNSLLADGAAPAADTETLLMALGLDGRRAGRSRYDSRLAPGDDEQQVLDLCRAGACSLESVAEEIGGDLRDAALRLARLERGGWVVETGGWFEAVDEFADLA